MSKEPMMTEEEINGAVKDHLEIAGGFVTGSLTHLAVQAKAAIQLEARVQELEANQLLNDEQTRFLQEVVGALSIDLEKLGGEPSDHARDVVKHALEEKQKLEAENQKLKAGQAELHEKVGYLQGFLSVATRILQTVPGDGHLGRHGEEQRNKEIQKLLDTVWKFNKAEQFKNEESGWIDLLRSDVTEGLSFSTDNK